jgi:hypothetical protein
LVYRFQILKRLTYMDTSYMIARENIGATRRHPSHGFVKPMHALIVAAVLAAGGAAVYFGSSKDTATSSKSSTTAASGEVDFGLAELLPGRQAAVVSYKQGGNMVLYAGEEFQFQIVGNDAVEGIELRVGNAKHILTGKEGKIKIAGPANQPQPATMIEQGSRLQLPGSAPTRISVKVQVYGPARPKS